MGAIKWLLILVLVGSLGWCWFSPLDDGGTNLVAKLRECGALNIQRLYGQDVVQVTFVGTSVRRGFSNECNARIAANGFAYRESVVTLTADNQCRVYELGLGLRVADDYSSWSSSVTQNSAVIVDKDLDWPVDVRVTEMNSTPKCSY